MQQFASILDALLLSLFLLFLGIFFFNGPQCYFDLEDDDDGMCKNVECRLYNQKCKKNGFLLSI